MNARILCCVLAAAAAILPACNGKSLFGGAPTCEEVVKKTIDTFVAEQGEQSLLRAEYTDKLTEGCSASKTMETHRETGECILAASSFATLKDCKDLNAVVKLWMTSAK
ncbi:MAG TPA: hypothetical protein VFG69_19005 [Nannocystaceae bacterium]|nr:hypothetical protein [Nannocystaceae bacterium]